MGETFIGKFLRNNFYFQRLVKRIPIVDLGDGRKYLTKEKRKVDLGRFIQPIEDKTNVIPVVFDVKTKVSVLAVALILLQPPVDAPDIWEIIAITASHNDTSNREGQIFYESGEGTGNLRLGHETLIKNVETLIYPVFHDESGLTHDHIIDIGPLSISRRDNSRVGISLLGANNGKVLTLNYVYRRIY